MVIQGRDRCNSLLSLVSDGHGSISTLSESGFLPVPFLFRSPSRSFDCGNPSPNLLMHKRNVNENHSEESSTDANQSDAGKSVVVACVENNVPKRQRTSTRWKPFSSTGRRSSVEQSAFGGRELGPPVRRYKISHCEFSERSSPERPVSPKCFSRHIQGVTRGLQHGRDCSNLYTWRRSCPQSRFFRRM